MKDKGRTFSYYLVQGKNRKTRIRKNVSYSF